MDTHHVILNCNTLARERRELHRMCEEAGGVKPKMARKLIRSRKTTQAVLGFKAASRVGMRTQRLEEEMERQGRESYEAWDLDAERQEGDKEEITGREREDTEKGGKG